jgi:transcriptional regulator with XRE-family HTH domain|tara:strand:+ start:305260 stop:305703 length:444 start_codon:yes stop_codon:yes gene_type:complete
METNRRPKSATRRTSAPAPTGLETAGPPAQALSAPHVLATALLNAGTQLNLNHSELAAVLGLHRSAISRLKQNRQLKPDSKQGELALMLIRIHQALHALNDGNLPWMQHFMHSPNHLTGQVPAHQIQNIEGLFKVMLCVEALQHPAA